MKKEDAKHLDPQDHGSMENEAWVPVGTEKTQAMELRNSTGI